MFSTCSSIQACFEISVSSVLWLFNFVSATLYFHPVDDFILDKNWLNCSWHNHIGSLPCFLWASSVGAYKYTRFNNLLRYIPKNSDWFWICLAVLLTGIVSSPSWTCRVQEWLFWTRVTLVYTRNNLLYLHQATPCDKGRKQLNYLNDLKQLNSCINSRIQKTY